MGWINKSVEREVEKAHITLMQHPKTGFYSGVMLLGKSEITDDVPTACTDGLNTYYGRAFMAQLANPAQFRFLVMHETKHKADKHMFRFKDLMEADAQLANAAMDYAINDEIVSIEDSKLVEMPPGGLYDQKFHLWSVREIHRFLKTGQQPNQPNQPRNGKAGQPGGPPLRDNAAGKIRIDGKDYSIGRMDEHDPSAFDKLTKEQKKAIEQKIDKAIQDGGFLAGINKVNMPRGLLEALTPDIDWKSEFIDFVTSHVKGFDEYTWRKFDRRRLADKMYLPGTYSEKMTELVVAPDLSGSIGDQQMQEWFGALYAAVQSCKPDIVRVLWWDMDVNAEQIFHDGDYDSLLSLLKPRGGGGTHVGCVSAYMKANNIKPDCLVVFTDGYVEGSPVWDIDTPTLWLVTENDNFVPPKGQRVTVNARG